MPFNEVELFARLIQCEAGGEGLLGMQAVASVVMNRVNALYGEYARVSEGGSIRNIIMQPGQFACAQTEWRGMPNEQNIYNMSPEPIHFEVAQWAMDGNRVSAIGDALWYYAHFGQPCCLNFPSLCGVFLIQIGGHCFYAPTEAYLQT